MSVFPKMLETKATAVSSEKEAPLPTEYPIPRWGLETLCIIRRTWNLHFKTRRSETIEGRIPWIEFEVEGALLGLNCSLWFFAERHWQECNALAIFSIRMCSWLAFVKETALMNAAIGTGPNITALKYQGWGPNIKTKALTKTSPCPYNWSLRRCLINRLCWSNSSSVSCRSRTTSSIMMGLWGVFLCFDLWFPAECLRTWLKDWSFRFLSTGFSLILKYVVDWAMIRWTNMNITQQEWIRTNKTNKSGVQYNMNIVS